MKEKLLRWMFWPGYMYQVFFTLVIFGTFMFMSPLPLTNFMRGLFFFVCTASVNIAIFFILRRELHQIAAQQRNLQYWIEREKKACGKKYRVRRVYSLGKWI